MDGGMLESSQNGGGGDTTVTIGVRHFVCLEFALGLDCEDVLEGGISVSGCESLQTPCSNLSIRF